MKRVAITTLNGYYNFGNRLQLYALSKSVSKYGFCVDNITLFHSRKGLILDKVNSILCFDNEKIRSSNFYKFTHKNIRVKNYLNTNISVKYKYFIVGSDQVWNYTYKDFTPLMFMNYVHKEKNISYAASFGVNNIPKNKIAKYKEGLNNIKYISVREDRGKELVKEITGRDDAIVLVDPTMLLTSEEWDKVSKKPKMLKTEKYILNYFLGDLSQERRKEIEKIAKENNCEVINILDKNSPFYVCGPSEFLYLEKHAFLICTDSFHSSVFAILYNRPFVIFDREQEGMNNMGSRLDTLLNKFKLKNRRYNGKYISNENLKHDYTEAYKILETERIKSEDFLKKSLNIKSGDNNGR